MANGTWKIARRSNVQLPLVIVLALAVVLVLLGRAQSHLFDQARMRLTDLMAPALEGLHAPVESFNRWIGSIGEIFVVYKENLALKDENARLRQWRTVAVVMEARVKRYQALLHAVPDPAIDSRLARVIGRANRPFLQTMVLDAGLADGTKPGQAVVDDRGMIGRIYLAGQRTSWVILLTDLNSRVPVSVVSPGGASVQAMLTGDNTALPVLDTLSGQVRLQPGDQVVSSGDGGLLPPGLPIGTVAAAGNGYRVALLADPAASQDVEILAFRQPPEALPPVTKDQLPAAAAGLPPATGTDAPGAPAAAAPNAAAAPPAKAPAPKEKADGAPPAAALPAGPAPGNE